MKAPQLCIYLRHATSGERQTLTGGITVGLCKACQQELRTRLGEAERPATPIEQLARKEETVMQDGCIYEVHGGLCRLLCDKGQTMCPRHILVAAAEAKKKFDKETEALERKRIANLQEHGALKKAS